MTTTAESLDAAEEVLVSDATRAIYRLCSDGVQSIGGIGSAAGMLGMKVGDLRQSLDRDGRRLGVEHALAIGARLSRSNATLATKIASAFAHPMGLEVFPRVTLTPEERARRYEDFIRRMPHGELLLAELNR